MDGRPGRRIRGLGRVGLTLAGVLVAGVAFWGFASGAQGAEQSSAVYQGTAAVAVKTALATQGEIAASLSYTGEVRATSQVAVLPKGSGRIEKMLVDVGSAVGKGEPIAELETDSLRVQLSQAKANLAAARAKLAGMESGPRGEQVAQAKAALEAAEARRDAVRKGATGADIAAAQSAVDSARANVQIAKARLEALKVGPTQAEWAQAQAAVESARASLKTAEANLAEVKAGPKDAELWAAQNAVDVARANLYAANDRVQTWKGTSSDAEKMATGATSTSQAVKGSEAAQSALDAAVSRLNLLKSKPLPAELQAAESAVETARASLQAAETRWEQMKRGATAQDLAQAEGAVAAAEAAVAGAEARLKQLQEGPREEDLKTAESAVIQAQQALNLAARPYTKHDLEMARAGVAQAQAVVDLAELALKEAVVTSPVEGVVAERFQSAGSLVGPQTPIVSLISSGVEMVLGVEEGQIGQVEAGQKAEIAATAYPGELFPARVVLISPVAEGKSRSFQVRVRPEDAEGKLKAGMFAQVRIVTEERAGAVLVPKEAVVNRSGQSVVFVVKGETAEMRPVTLGLAHNGTVELASGLEAGEEVVIAGQTELRGGETVRKS